MLEDFFFVFFLSHNMSNKCHLLSPPPSPLLSAPISVLLGHAPLPPPTRRFLTACVNMNNSTALPICYCHRDRSSAKIMMFCAKPVGEEQHLRVWGNRCSNRQNIQQPGWKAEAGGRKARTVLRLSTWSPCTWLWI